MAISDSSNLNPVALLMPLKICRAVRAIPLFFWWIIFGLNRGAFPLFQWRPVQAGATHQF